MNRIIFILTRVTRRFNNNIIFGRRNHSDGGSQIVPLKQNENDFKDEELSYLQESHNKSMVVSTDENIYIRPFSRSFNIAAYVNDSESLLTFLKLNVDLSKIEKKPFLVTKLLQLDFERDCKNHIIFLKDFVSDLGAFITKNPMIFYEKLENLDVRINYLLSKNFQEDQIKRIVSKEPHWLMFSTTRIDSRLGFFKDKFNLTGEQIRFLATRQPRLITYNLKQVEITNFSVKEEMGFNENEIKTMVLNNPKIWLLNHLSLLRRFQYVHNIINISHEQILQNSRILLSRQFRIKQRHLFLKALGRAQYNPKKENFIPLMALAEGTDNEFCIKFAKCSVYELNMFLKSL